jgi:hypothetical protein
METVRSVNPNPNGAVAANSPAPARVPALPPTQRVTPANAAAPARLAPRSTGQGPANWDEQLQGDVARAQQALDYLDGLAAQLESVKGDLAARLSGSRGSRQLEARVRQLASTLDARKANAGGGVDAQLGFSGSAPASQRFRMRGLDIAALRAAGSQTLNFSIKGAQLTVSLQADMSASAIAARFDRALAPAGVHAALDDQGELVFLASEADWPQLRDNITVAGRGRVTTDEVPPTLSPDSWQSGDVDALRESLREVVQSLARVKRAQEAAAAALSAALTHATRATAPVAPRAMAQDFVTTASSPDYGSLLAISSALVGVSRERVLALLGLR